MRKLICILTAFILLLSISSCGKGKNSDSAGYPVTVYGTEISKCPQKVICLSPAVTDVIVSLGVDGKLIGVSDNCDIGLKLTTYGSSAMPETDRIVSSDAEVVIADGALSAEAIKKIKDAGKTVVITPAVAKYENLSAFYVSVASIFSGKENGKTNADQLFAEIDKRISGVKSKTSETKAKNAVIILSEGVAAPDSSFAGQMLSFAGGKNIVKDGYKVDYADIIKANPEHIFCPADMVDQIKSDKAFSETKAVKDGKVTAFSPLYFERYGENVALGVEIMASELHPDLVRSPLK